LQYTNKYKLNYFKQLFVGLYIGVYYYCCILYHYGK